MYLNVQMNKNNAYVHAHAHTHTHTHTHTHPHTHFFQAQAVLYFQPAGLLRDVSLSLTGGDKLLSPCNHSRSAFLPGLLLTLRLRHCRPLSVTLPRLLIYCWARGLHTPQRAAPRSPSSIFHTCLLSGLPWMHRVIPGCLLYPCLPLSDLSQRPADFISSIHLESTHYPPCALSLKAKDFWWVFLAAPSVEFSTNVTLCFSDLLPLTAVS